LWPRDQFTLGESEGQQEPVRNELLLKGLAVHLEAFQHRAPNIDKQLSFKEAARDGKFADVFARPFRPVDAHGYKNTFPLAALDHAEKVAQAE
jgi:hypothetical protein